MLDPHKIRASFPAIHNHSEVVYFDNASTTQKPQHVLNAVSEYHHSYCSNPHRSNHDWGMRTTAVVDEVRQKVASFLHLPSTEGIYFTSGATESARLIGLNFIKNHLNDGDQIIVSNDEHKTLTSSWSFAKNITGKNIKFQSLAMAPDGDYDIEDLKNKLSPRTKVVVLSHFHNVYGLEMAITSARQVIPTNIPIILDATQSVGHLKVDPNELGVQATYFSAHKMYGFSGAGVVWIEDAFNKDKLLFEQGTLNIEGIISLGAAIDIIKELGRENIQSHLLDMTQYVLIKLRQIPGVEFLPGPAFCKCASGHGILSFRKEGVSSQDLSLWLSQHGIYIRAGEHCSNAKLAQDSIRISFAVYNTKSEIDRLCQVLAKT